MTAAWVKRRLSWMNVDMSFLPFADAATPDMPMSRLLRLSLFQVTVGMAMALTVGTLNRVLIVELGVSASLVSVMVALPLLSAPFRALIGFKSDTHKSVLGWRRVPYIWFGTLLQFGGLAIMPFSLIVLSGDNGAPVLLGKCAAAFAFILIGAGLQTTQTAGLALATDLTTEDVRPRAVALMYVMLLVGMFASSLVFSFALREFTPLRLIQVIQGSALVTMVLNVIALWKQEARDPSRTRGEAEESFSTAWNRFVTSRDASRYLVAVGLGTAAFSMQDVLLEPYGGQVLGLAVGQTSLLTGLFVGGSLAAFGVAARKMAKGKDPFRLAGHGALVGLAGFAAIVFAAPLGSALLFRFGTVLIGFGSGLFSVSTLTAAMGLDAQGRNGLALGAWGAVQATVGGAAIGLGGILRDCVAWLATSGELGPGLASADAGYGVVYVIEMVLLLAALAAIGPLARHSRSTETGSTRFGLAALPS